MLVITGARDTQSRLYRIRYAGPDVVHRPVDSQQMLACDEYSWDTGQVQSTRVALWAARGLIFVHRGWNYLSH